MTWHQTVVVGNLGGDPELRYMQDGTGVCNFSLAASERWRDRATNEWREKTTWYRVAVWGNQAESCNTYLRKGRQVLVSGQVSARGYMDRNGEVAASLDLKARDVRFLGGRKDEAEGGGVSYQERGQQARYDESARGSKYTEPAGAIDDIPF